MFQLYSLVVIFTVTPSTQCSNVPMFRSLSSWLVPMRMPMPPCPTMTQRGVEPPFTEQGASSMGHCGTALLVVRYNAFQTPRLPENRFLSVLPIPHHYQYIPQACQTSTTCTLIVWRSPWSSAVINSLQRLSFTPSGRGIRKLCSVFSSL